MSGWVLLHFWVVLGRAGVFVRCLGRPVLAGSARNRTGDLPTVGCAITSEAVLWGRGGCRFLCGRVCRFLCGRRAGCRGHRGCRFL